MVSPPSTPSSSSSLIDKPFSITQIKAYIPIQLNLGKKNYDVWRELLETHFRSFGVYGHLDGSIPATSTTETQWNERDGLVKMWIYGTVSEQVLDTILKPGSTARDVWLTIDSLFRDNKDSRAMQYDNELRTMIIGDLSIHDYYHKLKNLSDLLVNVDSPITEKTLVMHLLNGLSEKYDNIINAIQHQSPFPSFTKARSMLLMEEQRLAEQVKPVPVAPASSASSTVMYSSTDQPDQRSQPPTNRGNYRGWGRGGRRGRGRNFHQTWNSQPYSSPLWAYGPSPWPYAPPPTYPPSYWPPLLYPQPPSQSYYPSQPAPQPPAHRGLLGQYPSRPNSEAHFAHASPSPSVAGSSTGYLPNALSQAFSTMSLPDSADANWYMDTGATNHVATQPGSSNQDHTPLQQ